MPVFSRTDLITDSEAFYASIITLLEDPEEKNEVRILLGWWDEFTVGGDACSREGTAWRRCIDSGEGSDNG